MFQTDDEMSVGEELPTNSSKISSKLEVVKRWLYYKFTWLWDNTPSFFHPPIDWLRDLTFPYND